MRLSGWLVMIPSTPRAMNFSMASFVFTVQTWTRIPAVWARRMFSSFRTVVRQLSVG